jgi:hypothetical protein
MESVRYIHRETRRKHNAEGRREGINPNLNYSKEILEAGKSGLSGDTKRKATSHEADELRKENEQLKQVVAELVANYKLTRRRWNRANLTTLLSGITAKPIPQDFQLLTRNLSAPSAWNQA